MVEKKSCSFSRLFFNTFRLKDPIAMSGKWVQMDDERPENEVNCEDSDIRNWEKRRRLRAGAAPKNQRKYIQNIVAFLWNEAKEADETVQFELKEGMIGNVNSKDIASNCDILYLFQVTGSAW